MSHPPFLPEPPETLVERSRGKEVSTNGAATNGDGAALKDPYNNDLVRCDTALRDGEPFPPLPAELVNTPFAQQADGGLRLLKLLARARNTVLDSEPSPSPGAGVLERVGPFRLVRELGRGGHGVVYLAVDERLGRQVALRLSRLETLLDADLRKRFLREAQGAGQLDHPRLVQLHEVVVFWDTQYSDYRDVLDAGGEVHALALSSDRKLVAAGTAQGAIRLWSVESGKLVAANREHGSHVAALAFSSDGHTLASAAGPGDVRLWNVPTLERLLLLPAPHEQVKHLGYSPDNGRLVAGLEDGSLVIWHADAAARREDSPR